MQSQFDFLPDNPVIVGVDEVGRGPLIGDVVAAAVVLPEDCQLPLKDSKKLNETKRQELAELIKQQALAYSICVASPDEIDQLNILHATMLAMKRAVESITVPINKVLVDGNRCPQLNYECEAIVKGDDKVMQISAASIIAKVYRDHQMIELDKAYPQYGFKNHKGYPTKAHLQAIKAFGMIPGYRKSFKPIKNLLQDQVD